MPHRIKQLKASTRQLLLLSTATITVMFSSFSSALPSDRQQPIQIEADRVTYNERNGSQSLSGNVVIVQGTFRMQSSSVVAKTNSKGQIQTVVAKGSPAKFQQQINAKDGMAKGSGNQINYNADTGIVTVTGNAYLSQNGRVFRGNTVRYSINAGDIEATGTGKNRVKIVIPPSANQTFPGIKN